MKFLVFRFAVKIFARGNLARLSNEQHALTHGIAHSAMAHVEGTLLNETQR